MWRQEYQNWTESKNIDRVTKKKLGAMNLMEIKESFHKKLIFGTGGVRGLMGVGTSKLNVYTIRKVTLGFARYLKSIKDTNMIVIAYDSRKNSKEFADEAGYILETFGFEVFMFDQPTPTPELSFAVRQCNADAGIVITASHNPSEYNGFKVYNNEGAQAVPEMMEKIERYVDESTDYIDFEKIDYHLHQESKPFRFLEKNIDEKYIERVLDIGNLSLKENNQMLDVLYSPLHGAGIKLIPEVLERQGLSRISVLMKQSTQTGDFETVVTPNPEVISAFDGLKAYAKAKNYDLLLATDPDADRIGVMCLHNNKYIHLTGNEIGILLLDYILSLKGIETKPNNRVVLSTIVTTSMIQKMATDFGVGTKSFLTGFKYIGEHIEKLSPGDFVFGLEESCGYLINPFVRDKDSMQSAVMIVEMAYKYKNMDMSLIDRLQRLYQKYGYHSSIQLNLNLDATNESYIEKTMSKFEVIEGNSFPSPVSSIENYNTGIRQYKSGIVEKIELPIENVLKIIFEDDSWIAVRPSGTEPKMKIYIECIDSSEWRSKSKLEFFKNGVMRILKDKA